MPFDRERIKAKAAQLAAKGAYIGTSSWKCEGWMGQLYSSERYEYRGKVAKTRFERECLSEYAEVFKTVCVDAAYYTFPRREYLTGLADQVPDDFRFGFKVTDTLTIKKYPINSVLREFLRAAPLRGEHCQGGAQNPQGANSAAQPFEQYLDKRSGAVERQWPIHEADRPLARTSEPGCHSGPEDIRGE